MTSVRPPRGVLLAVVGLVVGLVAGLCGCTRPAPPGDGPVSSPSAVVSSPTAAVSSPAVAAALPTVDCAHSIRTGPLPVWARDGFSDDGSSFRHVEGLRGAVVGVVFGYPLVSPPARSRANKILWVAQNHTAGRLHIDSQLDGRGPVVGRDVGFGGGQSIVDLPRPGCWRMTLHWGDAVTDVVDLPYGRPR